MAKIKGRRKAKARKAKVVRGGPGWTATLTLLTMFILLVGGIGVSVERAEFLAEKEKADSTTSQLLEKVRRDLDNEIFFIAATALQDVTEPNLVKANILMKKALDGFFEERYDPLKLGKDRVTVQGHGLELSFMPMQTESLPCGAEGGLWWTDAFTIPTYYRISGNVTIEISMGGTDKTTHTIHIDRMIPDISPFVAGRLDELQANSLSEFTDIGRMVRYMLTTLVRIRASMGYGSGPYSTEKDLLNEGDVELAVNMAILLEEARLFGWWDTEAADAVDHYFVYANDPTEHLDEPGWEPYNPTGLRPWGSAERKAYARYLNKGPTTVYDDLNHLMEQYYYYGKIDPADLMALYMRLDRDTDLDVRQGDTKSILETEFLFEARHPEDRRDVSNIEYQLPSPNELVFRDVTGNSKRTHSEILEVNQTPDYLVMGSDIKVNNNITVPYKWMTNVKLSESSRTGGVPPPQPPPEHDWVMLWEFKIWGEFDISVGKGLTNRIEDGGTLPKTVDRTITLDIPINIFTPLWSRPMNNAMLFTNLNVGSPPGATYNFTLESLAYEYFSNDTWYQLKDTVGAVLDDVTALIKGSTCPYHGLIGRGVNMTNLMAGVKLAGLSDDVWKAIDDLVDQRLAGVGLSTAILKPFLNFEYFIDVDYISPSGIAGVEYILRLTIRANTGNIVIDLMRSDGVTGPMGWASVSSKVKVEGLLDVDYKIVWDEGFHNLRPLGSGTIGGDWSLPVQLKGQQTKEFVVVTFDIPYSFLIIPEVTAGQPSPIQAITATIPAVCDDPTACLEDLLENLKGISLSSITLMMPCEWGFDLGTWTGYTASGQAIPALLEGLKAHAEDIIWIQQEYMNEPTAMGHLGVEIFGKTSDISLVTMAQTLICEAPLSYYYIAGQMFQVEQTAPSIRAKAIVDVEYTTEDHGTYATGTLTYREYSEVLLMNLEGPHE